MKGSDTRERLLRIGLDQMSVQGLCGVTLGQLARASGLSKSGLFAHFASKEGLQLQLLDEMVRVADAHVVFPAMKKKPGVARLTELFDRWLGWSGKAGLSGGCPVAAAIFELDDLDGAVRDRVVELEAHWRGLLQQIVTESITAGELGRRADKEQIVFELFGIYLAHHASSRLARDPEARKRAKAAFQALLFRYRVGGERS